MADDGTLVAIWNSECGDLPKVLSVGDSRFNKIRARMRDKHFAEKFRLAVIRIRDLPFANGDNDRGWRADFDYLIANSDNVTKVLEGKFAGKRKTVFDKNAETLRQLRESRAVQ